MQADDAEAGEAIRPAARSAHLPRRYRRSNPNYGRRSNRCSGTRAIWCCWSRRNSRASKSGRRSPWWFDAQHRHRPGGANRSQSYLGQDPGDFRWDDQRRCHRSTQGPLPRRSRNRIEGRIDTRTPRPNDPDFMEAAANSLPPSMACKGGPAFAGIRRRKHALTLASSAAVWCCSCSPGSPPGSRPRR